MNKSKKNKETSKTIWWHIRHFIGKLLLGFFILLLILIGFSQTYSFRNLLKNYILDLAKEELNGEISIGSIDGSLFSSIQINDISYKIEGTQFIQIKKIALSYSLISLINKSITINDIILDNAKFNLIKSTDEKWIFEKIIKKPKPPDTTKSSPFVYTIIIRNFQLNNCSFKMKDLSKAGVHLNDTTYSYLNFQDLILNDFNLRLSTVASIKEKTIRVKISDCNFITNTKDFNIENFSFNTTLSPERIDISNFTLNTLRSKLKLKLTLKDFDLFEGFSLEKLKDKQISLDIVANKFNFKDLTNLLPSVNMLDKEVGVELKAIGKFGNLDVNKLYVTLPKSNLNLAGNILNLSDPENLFFNVKISNSIIDGEDVNNLLPLYDLSFLKNYGEVEFEELTYVGEPIDFKSDFKVKTNFGGTSGNAKFNFKPDIAKYEISLNTQNLNLKHISNLESSINSQIDISGEGLTPSEMNSRISIKFQKSKIHNFLIDSTNVNITANDKIVKLTSDGKADSLKFKLATLLDFTLEDNPQYSLNASIKHFDIEKLTSSKYNYSDLNFDLNLKGENFSLNKISSEGSINLIESSYKNKKINPSNLTFRIDQLSNEKKYEIKSNIMDLTVSGNFLITDLIDVIPIQVNEISSSINKKIESFTKALPFKDTIKITKEKKKAQITKTKIKKINQDFDVNYSFKIKDISIINTFINNIQASANISSSGSISNDIDKFSFSLSNSIKYIWFLQDSSTTWLNNCDMKLTLNNKKNLPERNKLDLNLTTEIQQIKNTVSINNFTSKLRINSDSAFFRLITDIDTLIKIRTDGVIDISQPVFLVRLNQATVEYSKYRITNEGPLKFSFGKEGLTFEDFNFRRQKERLSLFGFFGTSGKQDLKITANKIDVSDIISNFVTDYPNKINGQISLNATIKGDGNSPILDVVFMLDSMAINKVNLGTFLARAHYLNQELSVESNYLDPYYAGDDLIITSTIPINLSFLYKGERLKKDDSLSVDVNFTNFNIAPMEALLTDFKNINGKINGGFKIRGTINNPNFSGNVKVDTTIFLFSKNNLWYNLNSQIDFTKNEITVNEINISNSKLLKKGGTLTAKGVIQLKDYEISNINIISTGSLLVLSDAPNSTGKAIWGDLFINTTEPIELLGNSENLLLRGNLEVKKANLTIPLPESQYVTDQETFKYSYKQKSENSEIDSTQLLLDSLMKNNNFVKSNKAKENNSKGLFSNFVSQLKITLSDEVIINFIINKELNQRLYTELSGVLFFTLIDGQAAFQGEILVTQDSYLTFYQRFNASGSLRFEGEISNPSLNIIGTYTNYYSGVDSTGSEVKEVTIRIKLQGTVKDLAKNLVKNTDNIQVLINNNLDETKDASDAIAFIIIGKFKNDLTAQDKSNISGSFGSTVTGAAASLLGSLVTSFTNSVLGDVIRSVDLQRVGEQTKISLSGRIEKLRFKLGGSTSNFQNLGAADIQLEYPIFEKLFLRLERKNAALRSTGTDIEMINELGLKYKYEF